MPTATAQDLFAAVDSWTSQIDADRAEVFADYADAAAAVGRGVFTSNTPPAKLQTSPAPSDFRRSGGEDWFEVALYLRWDPIKWEALVAALDVAKAAAQAPSKGADGFTSLPGSKGVWKVHAEGCQLGQGAGGIRCRWMLERDGIKFGLVNRPEPHPTRMSGWVRMTGEAIIALGDAEGMWGAVVRWLHELGAAVVNTKVSRVDMCVDLPGQSVDPFVEAFRDGRVIRRVETVKEFAKAPTSPAAADSIHWKGRRVTGLSIMGQSVLVRIYDKAVECRDLVKRAWTINRRWGGQDQEQAARIEFQLRREFLTAKKCKPSKKTGFLNRPAIDTVEDYFDKRAALAEYLCTQWLRFVEVGFDPRHTERAIDLPLWQRVRREFASWADHHGGTVDFAPLKRSEVKTAALWKQVRGVCEAVAARLHVSITGADDLLGFLNEGLWEHIEHDDEISDRIKRKTNTLAEVIADAPSPENTNDDAAPF